jgi:hypothetical protein
MEFDEEVKLKTLIAEVNLLQTRSKFMRLQNEVAFVATTTHEHTIMHVRFCAQLTRTSQPCPGL